MPRAPLRRRQLNRNGPVPRGASKINSSPAEVELEKKLASKPIGPRPNDSDDSDRLVVKGNGRRGRNVPRQEIYASGAVAAGDKPGNYPTRAQRRKNMSKATQEIIGTGQQEMREEDGSIPVNKQLHQLKPRSPTMNGVLKNATGTNQVPATTISPAVKPSILRPIQPTPAREDSILGTLKPRRRQPSILQNLDQDSSSFDLDEEEEFLPDDESTPFDVSKLSNKPTTPAPASPRLLSSSRKRKISSSNPLEPVGIKSVEESSRIIHSPEATPEPSLRALPVSALRESGRRQRENVRDEVDIMALPQSSSSPAPSPVKGKVPASTKSTKHPLKLAPVMTTKELQTHLMPTKRRRTERERKQTRSNFDIAADVDLSESEGSEQDVSNFLPSKKGKKTQRKGPLTKAGQTRPKAKSGKAEKLHDVATSTKSRSKSSTNHLITITSPILRPSTSNRETKSPSQHSTNISSNFNTKSQAGRPKPYGGFPHKGRGTAYWQDKENRCSHQAEEPSHPSGARAESTSIMSETGEELVAGGRKVQNRSTTIGKSKWAEIDAWDMDFEDVEVMTGSGSSSPTRR
ncbi:uncharacterized protein Z520_01678 [Fonsecaea multimorphosa CBS 102226]|uniref:Uncharacterized protein n=1 Tax=Fonsecaea multimorphosa CBS 102226 TaxID=1442371 RepID=A0A0D2HMY7_9EURO|nr:uncharacterized protein Z520_01678 [Fonsecaea multimorphosa CBS 102226]KIY03211.1 hypothetical protein Z520_01678 [Fonsecaea multimorphosa CBS 102226]OAL30451.1 hypothetical protein AYO22_01649 [Fonsecaea multimorphosa]